MSAFTDVQIDEVRRYWDRRPCNVRHSPAPVGTREYFDQVEARKYYVEPHIPRLADFHRWSDRRVLEVGCGIGTDTINFARAGARVTAVDLSEVSLDLARRRAELFGVADRVTFIAADAERLSEFVEPTPYDLIYSFGVIHHAPHPEKIVSELRSGFCNPETELRLMVYNRYSWKVLRILVTEGHGAVWDLDRLVARNSEAESGCPVTYTYSRRSVDELLQGFIIKDAFVDHIFPFRVRDYVQYRYVRNPIARHVPKSVWRRLERRLGWHLCVTAVPA